MKTLFVGAGLLLGVLALVLAVFHFGQRKLVYFADATRLDARVDPTFQLQRPDGITLRGWANRIEQPRALIYFGGNAETLQGTRLQLDACCADWAAYLVPYRGYGGSDGAPSSEAILADALALHDEVAKRHPGQPVALVGRSLGSGVAAWVASRRPVAKLVLVTPFDSLGHVAKAHYPWLPVKWLLRERYDSADWLRGKSLQVMVVRASHDPVIPAANTDALLRALPADTRVVTLQGDHNVFEEPARYRQALADFLRLGDEDARNATSPVR